MPNTNPKNPKADNRTDAEKRQKQNQVGKTSRSGHENPEKQPSKRS